MRRYASWVRSRTAAVVFALVVSACAHRTRSSITGAELYARVHELRGTGRATVGTVSIRTTQVLESRATGQAFVVANVIEKCQGDDPTRDVDCTLALLLDQRFTVTDHLPQEHAARPEHEDESRSIVTSVVVVGLGVAAAGGLVYGLATCEFAGCKAVFGVPLVLIGGAALFALGRD